MAEHHCGERRCDYEGHDLLGHAVEVQQIRDTQNAGMVPPRRQASLLDESLCHAGRGQHETRDGVQAPQRGVSAR